MPSTTSAWTSERRVAGPRRELKIAVDHERIDWARSLIRLHPAGFRATYPDRWINSVYFDSAGLANYEENVAGIAHRRKVRIRWYGELEGAGAPVLEFKIRKNGMGWKVRYGLEELAGLGRRSWNEVRTIAAAAVEPRDRLILEENAHPIIVNRYVREYFRSAGGECDLTLDACCSFFDQRFSTRPNLERRVPAFRGMVIEMKFPVGEEDRVRRIAGAFPFRLTKSSKYVNGVRSCMDAS